MTKKILHIILCTCVSLIFSSCNDDESIIYGDFFYEMVTYSGTNGNNAIFTFQSYEDSPIITLTADNLGKQSFPTGQRLLLNYVINEDLGNNALNVTVNGMSKVNTDTLLFMTSSRIDTLAKDALKIESVWRTGNYLNLRVQLQYTEGARIMGLVSDGEINENGLISCYQIQDLKGQTPYYWFETYFSYYIDPGIENPNCQGFRYHVNDLSYPDVKYYDFLFK